MVPNPPSGKIYYIFFCLCFSKWNPLFVLKNGENSNSFLYVIKPSIWSPNNHILQSLKYINIVSGP